MIKRLGIITFILFGIALLFYLSLPSPTFPEPISGFVVSNEPADKETPLRRGYYTNSTSRAEIMSHYAQNFVWGLRLNYPPEEAQTIIRDQTKATYLEEIAHPMRESIFVAGNEVQPGKPKLGFDGKEFNQKVIVKYVESNVFVRLAMGILTLALIWILAIEAEKAFKSFTKWIYR